MRILDEDNDRAIKSVSLYLTLSEARELLSDLENLISNPDNSMLISVTTLTIMS